MRRALFTLIAVAVVSVASTSGVVLSGAVFNNTASNTQSASAASDFVPPTVTAGTGSVIARVNANKPGYIQQGQQYVVYANVSDTGNPASGVQTVTANLGTVTTGATSVALTA